MSPLAPPAVLCIGGLDPAGRAGLLADARAVEAAGLRPLCVAAALTFQSTRGVTGFVPVAADHVRRQVEVLLRDEPVGALKLGQLGSVENAEWLTALAGELPAHLPWVVDTPLLSSSGAPLFPVELARNAYAPLFARAALVTPNVPEALLLAGAAPDSREDAEEAARALDAPAVLLKGGHREGDVALDVLLRGEARTEWRSPRLAGRFRGTGCRLAASIAAHLAAGRALEEAIAAARDWLHEELRRECLASS